MRHRKTVKKLGRTDSHRRAVLANLAMAIIDKERIRTTDALARESKRLVERLITKAKTGTLHARRQVFSVLRDKKLVAKLFDTIAPRYRERHGGYVRLIRVGNRHGDGAAISIVELIGSELSVEEPKKAKKKRKKKAEESEETEPVAPASGDKTKTKTKTKAKAKAKTEDKKEIQKDKGDTSPEDSESEDIETPSEEPPAADSESTTPEKEGGKKEGRG